jgi:uncharacterized protein Yka (UPF0111/DUF47 family)
LSAIPSSTLLRRLKKADTILKYCAEVDRLENEGDYLNRAAVAKLFEPGNDPLEVIKWIEIYETMENAIDRCEDVATQEIRIASSVVFSILKRNRRSAQGSI